MRRISAAHAVAWLSLADLRAELGIGIDVDGTRWRQVPNVGGSGSDDPHYVVRHGDHGATVVEFGDGVHGDRPLPGSSIAALPRAPSRGVWCGHLAQMCLGLGI